VAFEGDLDPVIAQHGPHGNAAGQGFGQAEHVGHHKLFAGKHGAGAAETGLDLVDNQQNTVGIADLTSFLEISLVTDSDTAFALDHFQQNRSGIIVNSRFQPGKVIIGDML
jgi:hypothetical protein